MEFVYPAVSLVYYLAVVKAYQRGELVLDKRASVHVLMVFVVAQLLCRILGGYTGALTFFVTAYLSYEQLPRTNHGGGVDAGRTADTATRHDQNVREDPTGKGGTVKRGGAARQRKRM